MKGICKFCGQEKELIKSHIIPKCFYQLKIRGPMTAIRPGSKDPIDKKNYQNGLKEPLMCTDCDNKLGTLDGYANRILAYAIKNHPFRNVDDIKTYLMQAPDFDYAKLRKFFISLAWRASVSSESFHLGKYEAIALQILKDEIPDDKTLFVPIVFRKNTQTAVDNITMFATNKYCGKTACLVRFPNYEIAIITNTKHSNNEQAMQLYKSMLTPREFLVIETNFISPDDVKLINAIRGCQKQLH